jgi:hypothetical protein
LEKLMRQANPDDVELPTPDQYAADRATYREKKDIV